MLIRHLPQETSTIEIQCETCAATVGIVTLQEFNGLLTGNYGRIMCYDCEGRADEIPAVLLDAEIPYWLGFKSEDETLPPTFVLIDPFRQARQNQERVDNWATHFREFVEDLHRKD